MTSAWACDEGRMEEGKSEVVQSISGSSTGPRYMKHSGLRGPGLGDAG